MSPPEVPLKISTILQNIKYTGNESEFSAKVVGTDVTVQCGVGQHTHGSSKVKLINRIDYNWEFQYYHGQLIAVHINGKIVAYGMKGKDGGMVRVTNQVTGDRALIKNLKTDIKDLSFAISKQQIILGCIDDEGNVMVYEIFDQPGAIKYNLLLHVFHNGPPNQNYRIIWCPYIASYEEEDGETSDDPEKMFVVLNYNKAEIWNYDVINSKYGIGPIEPNESYEGYVEINHTHELVDASFSSDGTAIAIACADGYVKFFQIYLVDQEKQKCLHEWRPHDGQPLSSIIFVDNLLECSQQCWKFTITGANHNSELKLWSCETWTCLQTIHFKPNPSSILPAAADNVFLKMSLDYTGQFLVLSDLNCKALYILQLKRSDEARQISVTTLSQFLLPTPFLSFFITEANLRKLPSDIVSSEEYPEQDDDDEDGIPAVVLKMLVIQTKKFQECNVIFHPESMLYASDISEMLVSNGDLVTDEKVPNLDDLQSSVTLLIQQHEQQQQMTLMTPEEFTEKVEINSPDDEVVAGVKGGTEGDLIDFQRPEKDNFASGGSSPSREVQEILSLNNSTYSTQDYFDNLTKMQEEQELPQKEYYNQEATNSNSDMALWLKLPLAKEAEPKDELRPLGGGDEISSSDWSKPHLQAINFRLTSIENALSDVSVQLQKLQGELDNAKSGGNKGDAGEDDVIKGSDIVKEIELAMSKQQLNIAKMFESLVNMNKNKEREHHDHMVSALTQIVSKTVSDKVSMSVAHEMKNVVAPTIRNLVEALKHQLDVQNTQKLNSDMILQDNIGKMMNGKALAESLSLSVPKVMTPILEKSYKDMVGSTILPTFEKVCAKMFHQLNDTFFQGTKEYTVSIEGYMDRQRRIQDRTKDLVSQLQQSLELLNESAEKLNGSLATELQKNLTTAFKYQQETLIKNLKDVISEQIKAEFKTSASALEDSVKNVVRSRTVTPSPQVDIQTQIDHLIAKDRYDDALQTALTAGNLQYVIYVCEKIDANTMFCNYCPEQNVILALIQQFSVDMLKRTELKFSYIRTALVVLKPNHTYTKQYIPKILGELIKALNLFINASPPVKFLTEAKLLKMTAEGILEK